MQRDNFIERQRRVIELSGVPAVIGVKLADWADWMRSEKVGAGYPEKSAGFVTGGISCWDDLEDEGSAYACNATDAAIETLDVVSKVAISEVWLGCGWTMRRLDLEDVAVAAMQPLWRALMTKGVL